MPAPSQDPQTKYPNPKQSQERDPIHFPRKSRKILKDNKQENGDNYERPQGDPSGQILSATAAVCNIFRTEARFSVVRNGHGF
jgi:hypothetical protein